MRDAAWEGGCGIRTGMRDGVGNAGLGCGMRDWDVECGMRMGKRDVHADSRVLHCSNGISIFNFTHIADRSI